MTYEHSISQPPCRKICRLCTKEDETLWNIFETCDSDGSSLQLVEKIITCLDVMVEINDGLPNLICAKCMTVIRCFFDFRQQCKDNDSMFRACLLTSEEPFWSQEEKVIPNSIQFCTRQEDGNISEEKLSLSVSEQLCDRLDSQHAEESSELIRPENMQDTSLVKQLQDEWAEDDYDNVLHSAEQHESPWRLYEEDSFKNYGDKSLSDTITDNFIGTQNQTIKDYFILDDNWNPHPEEHDLSEKYEDPLSNITEQQEKANAPTSVISCDNLFLLENSDSESVDVEVIDDDKNQKEKVPQSTNKENSSVEEVNTKVQDEQLHMSEEESFSRVLNEGSVVSEIFAGRVKRNKLGKWTCDICNSMHSQLSGLKKHVLSHYRTLYQCHECLARFDGEEALALHKTQHVTSTLVLGYSCQHCCKSFRHNHLLLKHIAVEHFSSSTPKAIPKKFRETCGKCFKVFYSSLQMENHDESCGDNSTDSENEFRAPIATHSASSKQVIRNHRKFECPSCTLIFHRPSQFSFHSKKVHNIVPKYKCKSFACEKEFNSLRMLTIHENCVHKNSFTCDYCKKQFPLKLKLADHIRTHTGETPYKCDLCERSYKTSRTLIKHKHTHSKKFKCETCGKGFGSKHNLQRHCNSHIGKYSCICEYCGSTFINRRDLRAHVKLKHLKN